MDYILSMPCFYPRHPRGWRQEAPFPRPRTLEFLSTPPSRVATCSLNVFIILFGRFYPRHPRGWRPGLYQKYFRIHIRFYPRHPRGWRPPDHRHPGKCYTFLSTPPSRVATFSLDQVTRQGIVSIHATLAGGDFCRKSSRTPSMVSIHATLAGGDDVEPIAYLPGLTFLSTPPSRGATPQPLSSGGVGIVSIHATLAGGDEASLFSGMRRCCFYPRHPRGWRQCVSLSATPHRSRFYPRHPRGWRLAA